MAPATSSAQYYWLQYIMRGSKKFLLWKQSTAKKIFFFKYLKTVLQEKGGEITMDNLESVQFQRFIFKEPKSN